MIFELFQRSRPNVCNGMKKLYQITFRRLCRLYLQTLFSLENCAACEQPFFEEVGVFLRYTNFYNYFSFQLHFFSPFFHSKNIRPSR